MKIAIDKAVEIEVEPWSIKEAGDRLQEIRQRHPERFDQVLRGMFTLLLFANIESQHPGSMQRFLQEAGTLAEQLNPPRVGDD